MSKLSTGKKTRFTPPSSATIRAFQKKIFKWWSSHKRDLPWRHTRDPYKIFVSEFMLQQTQVSRVLPKYIFFLDQYPTVMALASASLAEVLRSWKGLGYNRRALYLHRSAVKISSTMNGVFPDTEETIRALPGVGLYTARALLVFAYQKDVAMVDTNIRKIITNFFYNDQTQPAGTIDSLASALIPKGKSWEWHQALMDYGALELVSPNAISKKTNIPFRESRRFFRGKILDILRDHSILKSDLTRELLHLYGKDDVFYESILHDLERDGLVTIAKDIVSLPR